MDHKESHPNQLTSDDQAFPTPPQSPFAGRIVPRSDEAPSPSGGALGIGTKRKFVVENKFEEVEEAPPLKLQTIDDEHAFVVDEEGFFRSEPIPEPMETEDDDVGMNSLNSEILTSAPRNVPLVARRRKSESTSSASASALTPDAILEEDMMMDSDW